MKRLLSALMCLCLTLGLVGCSTSETGEQPDDETIDEEIPEEEKISDETEDFESQKKQESIVLIDEKDIYIEYRGIDKYSSDVWIINLYVENNSESDINIGLIDELVNKSSIGFSNSSATIPANSNYLSVPNFDMLIPIEDLPAYEITHIDNIKFNLNVSEGDTYESILNVPVTLDIDMDI